MTIGRIATLADVGVETIRFYERDELIEARYLTGSGIEIGTDAQRAIDELATAGKTTVLVARNRQVAGVVALAAAGFITPVVARNPDSTTRSLEAAKWRSSSRAVRFGHSRTRPSRRRSVTF